MVYNCSLLTTLLRVPAECLLCRQDLDRGPPLCRACERGLPWQPAGCRRCAAAMPGLDPGREAICGRCLQHPPAFDRCHAPLAYAEPVSGLITRFKFHGQLAEGRVLSRLLARHVLNCLPQRDRPELLLPVPMHPRRLRRRGFNQAVEIARSVARQCRISLDAGSCRKSRSGPAQRELAPAARRRNPGRSFTVRPGAALTGARHVAIIDDVITTGATVSELARVLRRAGIERIDVWALARTNPQ